jgi:hypothetical protein
LKATLSRRRRKAHNDVILQTPLSSRRRKAHDYGGCGEAKLSRDCVNNAVFMQFIQGIEGCFLQLEDNFSDPALEACLFVAT